MSAPVISAPAGGAARKPGRRQPPAAARPPRPTEPVSPRVPHSPLVAFALVVAFGLGTFSAIEALKVTLGFGGIHARALDAFPQAQTADADPYASASGACGALLLGSAEGLAFYARTDSKGIPLDAGCTYENYRARHPPPASGRCMSPARTIAPSRSMAGLPHRDQFLDGAAARRHLLHADAVAQGGTRQLGGAAAQGPFRAGADAARYADGRLLRRDGVEMPGIVTRGVAMRSAVFALAVGLLGAAICTSSSSSCCRASAFAMPSAAFRAVEDCAQLRQLPATPSGPTGLANEQSLSAHRRLHLRDRRAAGPLPGGRRRALLVHRHLDEAPTRSSA